MLLVLHPFYLVCIVRHDVSSFLSQPTKFFCKNVLFQASGCIAMPKEGLVDHCQSHNHEVWQLILETLKEQ